MATPDFFNVDPGNFGFQLVAVEHILARPTERYWLISKITFKEIRELWKQTELNEQKFWIAEIFTR